MYLERWFPNFQARIIYTYFRDLIDNITSTKRWLCGMNLGKTLPRALWGLWDQSSLKPSWSGCGRNKITFVIRCDRCWLGHHYTGFPHHWVGICIKKKGKEPTGMKGKERSLILRCFCKSSIYDFFSPYGSISNKVWIIFHYRVYYLVSLYLKIIY